MATTLQQMTLPAHPINASFLGGLRKKVAAYRVYRETLNELRSLNDRDLADLGLSRASLKRVALEAAYDDIN